MNYRIKQLSDATEVDGKSVVYVMSRDQRIRDNHALLAAQETAQEAGLPLIVAFAFYTKSDKRCREHFDFMIEGLKEVEKTLGEHNIAFMKHLGDHESLMKIIDKDYRPAAVYFDMSPLRGPRNWQRNYAENAKTVVSVVDTHNIVPVWRASDKQEFAAHTIRKKIHGHLPDYLVEPPELKKMDKATEVESVSWSEIEDSLEVKKSGIDVRFDSGEKAAHKRVKEFGENELENYAELRNDPNAQAVSDLSPYLHFGQISSLRVILDLLEITGIERENLWQFNHDTMPKSDRVDSEVLASLNHLIEEMLVRKELADNFCYFNQKYDSYEGAPDWAKESHEKHRDDPREHIYSYEELEQAETHDEAWNAAQRQLTRTGKMHGYMRMYWAKKILEWTESPEQAIDYAVKLNDFYSIDGGDPNGYTGIMWSIVGVHDRPWNERDVFGKIRYMNYGGLKRKFNIEEYVSRWVGDSTKQ